MGHKLPDTKRAQIVDDIRQRAHGGSCRGIARHHGISHAKVSQIAKEEGLSFERVAQTAAATAAAEWDARQTRALLIRRAYDHASHFLDRARQPYTVTVTTQHGIDWVTYTEPPAGEQRNLMTSFGISVDKALALEKHDSTGGLDVVVSLLDSLRDGLAAKHGTGDDEHPAYDGGEPVDD
jgi:hypothetical protein